ncbi:MAG TPA: class I SAM-dependent methyltransferase [Ktedonobacterales bacterium]
MTTNAYSSQWFQLFMPLQSEEMTAKEVAFLARQLPLPRYRRILDLCCGYGRHALGLAALGYAVTGLDRDADAIAEARRRTEAAGLEVAWITGDMLEAGALTETYDAVINMWQSLSYFDDATNATLLRALHEHLTPGGRLIVDSFNRDYFARNQGERLQQIGGVTVATRAWLDGDRWHSALTYRADAGATTGSDHFDWRIYTPEAFRALASDCGFVTRQVCSWADEAIAVTPESARMQMTIERA